MKEIYDKYLSILRAFVQKSAPPLLDTAELKEILNLAYINSTSAMVYYVYLSHPELIDNASFPDLRTQCFQSIALYAKRADKMKTLLKELNQNGIDCILFKGFIVKEFYPIPELRTFGDIDFVIREADRKKCDALMKQLGYEPKANWEPVFSYLKGIEYYEIHTNIMDIDVSDKANYVSYFGHMWEYIQPSETVALPHVFEFSPEFHFLYLLTHIAKHISNSGAGIRMYLDIALFVQHYGASIDWSWIEKELKMLHLTDFANMAFHAVEQWFGASAPVELRPVSEQLQNDFLEFTLEAGVYGYIGRDKSLVFLKQQNRNEEKVSKVKTLLFHAFPPRKSMESRYSYLQDHPWLLPAAWVHRLIGSKSEWGRFADHTKNIIRADSEEVLKLKRIYKEIGL